MNFQVALQWTLDHTVDQCVKVGRDVLLAANKDDVQPLALIACERFGATLAICPETRSKIEFLVRSQTESTIIGFLKAKAGYPKNGSMGQLSRSLAGINFLALAAALVSSTDTFEVGTALEKMISSSATDHVLTPTARQIKDLLNVLEPQLNRAGFMDEVLSWKEWWMAIDRTTEAEKLHLQQHGESFPSPDGLEKIVTALRSAYRIGQAKTVTLTARSAAPWLTAFVIWCIGVFPTVYSHDGRVLHSQPHCPLAIVYSEDSLFEKEIKLEITHQYDSFTEMVSASIMSTQGRNSHFAAGMVKIQNYAKHVIERLGYQSDLKRRVILQALPYALRQVRNSNYYYSAFIGAVTADLDSLPLTVVASNPYPPDWVIADTMRRYLSLKKRVDLATLEEGSLISDLPLVRTWLKTSHNQDALIFESDISLMVADILALSLFHGCQDSLLVYYSSSWHKTWHTAAKSNLSKIIKDTLLGKTRSAPLIGKTRDKSLVVPLLSWALKLLHHEVSPMVGDLGTPEWVGSSFKGQVVFPKVFEDLSLRQDGYLELFCIAGVLTKIGTDHKPYSLVKGQTNTPTAADTRVESTPITRSLNLFPDERLVWRVVALDDCILVGMSWSQSLQNHRVNPYGALLCPSMAFFSGSCQHDLNTSTEDQLNDCKYALPCSDLPLPYGVHMRRNMERISIYPTEDNNGLRLLALSAFDAWNEFQSPKILISGGACIDCLIHTCRLGDFSYLIL